MNAEKIKEAAGRAAVDELVRSGMKLGLGTGSTAVWAVRRVGELLAEGNLSGIRAVPTSFQTEIECQKWKIPLYSMNDPEIGGSLDLTIDGADEIDARLCCTKGGGGALLIEKVAAYASSRTAIVADYSKKVSDLGLSYPIPNEVLPAARLPVTAALERMSAEVMLRMAEKKMGPVVTDNGNIILDIRFPEPFDPAEMEDALSRIPGLLGNGLFTRIKPRVYIGLESGKIETLGTEA